MGIQEKVFQRKLSYSLNYGFGLSPSQAKLEVVQVRYFKTILGLKDSFSSVELKKDFGLFPFKSVRLVIMVKFREKIIKLPNY